MSTTHELRNAIDRLVEAAVNHSWKGGAAPADVPEIEQELVDAQAAVDTLLNQLTRDACATTP